MIKIFVVILISFLVLLILVCLPIIPNIENHKNIKFSKFSKVTSRQVLQLLEQRNPAAIQPTNKDKIITLNEWDCSGFNNVRMNFEIVCGLAMIYNRTIVLPPKHIWDHLPKIKVDLSNFYSIDNLRAHFSLLTHSEYTGKDQSYSEFIDEMKNKNGLSDDLLLKLPNKYKELEKEQETPIWFFPACKKMKGEEVRLFGNFNSLFRNENKLSNIRKAIRYGFKFRSDLLDLVPILPAGQYDAIHIRRGDFKWDRKNQVLQIKTLQKNLKKLLNPKKKNKLLIITDEKDKSFFDPLKKNFDIFFNKYENVPKLWIPFIDILSCISARRFFGTRLSTFSYYIQILRGYCVTNNTNLINMIDDSPEFHKIEPTSLIVKIGKKWNCKGNCWDTIDTEQWRDPNSLKDTLFEPFANEIPIVIYYHIAEIGDWENIVNEQLDLIHSTGLYKKCKEIRIGFLGTKRNIMKFITDKVKLVYT